MTFTSIIDDVDRELMDYPYGKKNMPQIRKQTPRLKKKVGKKRVQAKLSIADRITPIGFDKDEGIKINLYGRSATGKTRLWSTFPKPILVIICSGGSRPGEVRSINTFANRKTIKKFNLEKSSEVRKLVDLQNETEKFATVVLDHATSLQDYVLREILNLAELPEQLSWGIATRKQWGQVAVQMKEILRSLLNLKCNVVIVAQEREFNLDSDSDLITPYVASALSPSTTGWLNPAVDYIGQTRIRSKTIITKTKVGKKTVISTKPGKGVEYTLRTGPDPVYTSKFRVPLGTPLPDEIINPTYDKIMEIINGGTE